MEFGIHISPNSLNVKTDCRVQCSVKNFIYYFAQAIPLLIHASVQGVELDDDDQPVSEKVASVDVSPTEETKPEKEKGEEEDEEG